VVVAAAVSFGVSVTVRLVDGGGADNTFWQALKKGVPPARRTNLMKPLLCKLMWLFFEGYSCFIA